MSLDNFRNRTIIWDTVNKDFPQPVQIMQGDVNARTLLIKVLDNGTEVDLTGNALKLTYQYTNNSNSGFVMIPPKDLTKGEFILVIPTEMTVTGVIEANLILLNENLEQVIVSKSLTFISDNSTVTDLSQEVNNKIDDFTKLLLENMPQVMRSELDDLHTQTESNKNNIELKSNKTDLESLRSAVNNQSATISTKANQTDLNNLQTTVNSQGATISTIDNKVSSVSSGAPKAVSLASSMTDKTKNYVYTGNETGYTSGNWYYWSGTNWVSGGVYQSAGIAEKSVTKKMLSFATRMSKNLYDISDVVVNAVNSYNTDSISNGLVVSKLLNANSIFCLNATSSNIGKGTRTLPAGSYYLRMKAMTSVNGGGLAPRICDVNGNYVRLNNVSGTLNTAGYVDYIFSFTIPIDYVNYGFMFQNNATVAYYTFVDMMLSTDNIVYEPFETYYLDENTKSVFYDRKLEELKEFTVGAYIDGGVITKTPEPLLTRKSKNLFDFEKVNFLYNVSKLTDTFETNAMASLGIFCINANTSNIGKGSDSLASGTYFLKLRMKRSGGDASLSKFRICDASGAYVEATKILGNIESYYSELVYKFTISKDYSNFGFLIQVGPTAGGLYDIEKIMISSDDIPFMDYKSFELSEKVISPQVSSISDTIKSFNNPIARDLFKGSRKYIAVGSQTGFALMNTKEAVVQAAHLGYFGVEIDIRMTNDGDIVCIHDENTSLTLNSPAGKLVSECTTTELKTYFYKDTWIPTYYPNGVKIMTLDECIEVCRQFGLFLFIDIKNDGNEAVNQTAFVKKIINKVLTHGIQGNCAFTTASPDTMALIRSILPNAIISMKLYIARNDVVQRTVEQDLVLANKLGGNLILQGEDVYKMQTSKSVLTDERVLEYHKLGMPVKDIDFVFTQTVSLPPTKSDKISYKTKITTADNGLTWTENPSSIGLTITPYGVNQGLLIKSNVLDHMLLATANPTVLVDGFFDDKLKLTCGYSLSDAGYIIKGTYNGDNFMGNLPDSLNTLDLRLNFI